MNAATILKFIFHRSFANSRDRVKGHLGQRRLLMRSLPGFSPLGAVFDNPIGQRALKPDVVSGFLGLDPFVAQNLFALGLELAVKRRIFY